STASNSAVRSVVLRVDAYRPHMAAKLPGGPDNRATWRPRQPAPARPAPTRPAPATTGMRAGEAAGVRPFRHTGTRVCAPSCSLDCPDGQRAGADHRAPARLQVDDRPGPRAGRRIGRTLHAARAVTGAR